MVVGFVQTSSWISFFCSGGGQLDCSVTCPSAGQALTVITIARVRAGGEEERNFLWRAGTAGRAVTRLVRVFSQPT